MKFNFPAGWYLYAVLIAGSSLLIPLGLHRAFYSLLHTISFPEFAISALAGIAGLSWYELAYVLGGALKNVHLFVIIPFLGSVTGLLSAVLLFTRVRLRAGVLRTHLVFGVLLGSLSLAVLVLRFLRGYGDVWRCVTTVAFLGMYSGWLFYFHRRRRFLHSP